VWEGWTWCQGQFPDWGAARVAEHRKTHLQWSRYVLALHQHPYSGANKPRRTLDAGAVVLTSGHDSYISARLGVCG